MKKFFAVLMVLVLAEGAALVHAGDGRIHNKWNDAVYKAQDLKAKGDYEGAALVHPRALCRAMYYWNAACKVVGHKKNGNWVINATVTDEQKTKGLALLKQASFELDNATQKAGLAANDDGTCKGVDAGDLRDLIQKVTDCINGHCQ